MDREITKLISFDEVLSKYYDYQDIGGEMAVTEFVRAYYTPVYDASLDFIGYEKQTTPNINIQD